MSNLLGEKLTVVMRLAYQRLNDKTTISLIGPQVKHDCWNGRSVSASIQEQFYPKKKIGSGMAGV
jgi:hypothetical protein